MEERLEICRHLVDQIKMGRGDRCPGTVRVNL
jgi:hypothetical protein